MPMIRRLIAWLILFWLFGLQVPGQSVARFIPSEEVKYVLPFEVSQNLIVIPVRINDSPTMKFVLDTGISNTIITELTDADTISLNAVREVRITGLGNGESIGAYYSTGNEIRLSVTNDFGSGILGEKLDVYILMEDRFDLTGQLGFPVNGLIGMDLLRHFVIEFDYVFKTITFWDRNTFYKNRKIRRFEKIPLEMRNQKPYLDMALHQEDGSNIDAHVLIDTGASLAIWVAELAHPGIKLPSKTIPSQLGQGLSGEITGLNGRIPSLYIGPYKLKKPVVSYPDSASVMAITMNDMRHGSIGNELLRRFHVIMDFQEPALLLKPNKFFNDPFTYNRSGIAVEKPYHTVPVFRIFSVYPGSPGDLAGVKPGDEILFLNGFPVISLSLDAINAILHGEAGRSVRMQLQRDDKKIGVKMKLRSEI